MPAQSTLGARIRALRRTQRITQADLARRLSVSPSYLNLIEHNRRPLPAELLMKLAQVLPVDLKTLAGPPGDVVVADLLEAFGDPLFDNLEVIAADLRELAYTYPTAADAVLRLYEAYRATRESLQTLAAQMLAEGAVVDDVSGSRFPTEEVSDLLQRHSNYFPELEHGAEALLKETGAGGDSLFATLTEYVRHAADAAVRIEQAGQMQSALRRYDPEKRVLYLSEVLRRGSRNFQLAHQVCLLTQGPVLDRIANDPLLTTDESRALCRVALANYFASAVLMPYAPFLEAARAERYDIELLGHRFRTSFEQTCHRLTNLRRPGAEGIPLHMIRMDIAGNVSKRFSASGMRFARFSGACPRWNVFAAFQVPGMIRTQLSQFPDGHVFFEISRTVGKESGGYRAPHTLHAIALGCEVSYASDIVYADGLDLTSREAFVPVGPTCRLCDRMDCAQRAHPPIQHPLTVNENVRGVSFYAPLRT